MPHRAPLIPVVLALLAAFPGLAAAGSTTPRPGTVCFDPFTGHDYADDSDEDRDGDGFTPRGAGPGSRDCDDDNPIVHPGAYEVCDGFDSDWDGYDGVDADRDGGPGELVGRDTCGVDCLPATGDEDCDDGDAAVHGDAAEVADNGADDNCNGIVDEGTGNVVGPLTSSAALRGALAAPLAQDRLILLDGGVFELDRPIRIPAGITVLGAGDGVTEGATTELRCGGSLLYDLVDAPACVVVEAGAALGGVRVGRDPGPPAELRGLELEAGDGAIQIADVVVSGFAADGVRVSHHVGAGSYKGLVRLRRVVSVGHQGDGTPRGVAVVSSASSTVTGAREGRLELDWDNVRAGDVDGSAFAFVSGPSDALATLELTGTLRRLEAVGAGGHGFLVATDSASSAVQGQLDQDLLFQDSSARASGLDGWRVRLTGGGPLTWTGERLASVDSGLAQVADTGAGMRFTGSADGAPSVSLHSSFVADASDGGFVWEGSGTPDASRLYVPVRPWGPNGDVPPVDPFLPDDGTWPTGGDTSGRRIWFENYNSLQGLLDGATDTRLRITEGQVSAVLGAGAPIPGFPHLAGNLGPFGSLFDPDGDGVTPFGGDCDPESGGAHPGADESCDGLDNDCLSALRPWIEQTGPINVFELERLDPDEVDADGDGAYVCPFDVQDCDDADADTYPGAPDPDCDGIDRDCAGPDEIDADGDGYAPCEGLSPSEQPGAPRPGDCDESDASIHPGASELCDGVDQDCAQWGAQSDEVDADGDGAWFCGSCPTPTTECDCDDGDAAVRPGAPEVCDEAGVDRDDDCDGSLAAPNLDRDGDGVPDCRDYSQGPGCTVGCGAAGRSAGALLLLLPLLLRRRTRRCGGAGLALLLLPSPARADPVQDAALAAHDARETWCSDAALDDPATFGRAMQEVSPVLVEVDRVYRELEDDSLLYWRGVLSQCLGRIEPALADYQAFIARFDGNPDYLTQVQDSRTRVRRIERGDDSTPDGQTPLQAYQRRFPLVAVAAGAGLQLHFIFGDGGERGDGYLYGAIPVDASVRIVGPLAFTVPFRLAISQPAEAHTGASLKQRSLQVGVGAGLTIRGPDRAAPFVTLAAQVSPNADGTDAQLPRVLGGLLLQLGGEFQLGPTPVALRPFLEAALLGPSLVVRVGLQAQIRLPAPGPNPNRR